MLVNGTVAGALTDDGGAWALNVRREVERTGDDRASWAWSVWDDGALLAVSGPDDTIRSGVGADPDAAEILRTLVAFLESDADRYRSHMGRTQPDDGYSFGEAVAEWAYSLNDGELSAELPPED